MKPADRKLVQADVGEAVTCLGSILALVDAIADGNDQDGHLVAAIRPLAIEAHDRLDLATRALGGLGIGFRGRVAQRLEPKRPTGGNHETAA